MQPTRSLRKERKVIFHSNEIMIHHDSRRQHRPWWKRSAPLRSLFSRGSRSRGTDRFLANRIVEVARTRRGTMEGGLTRRVPWRVAPARRAWKKGLQGHPTALWPTKSLQRRGRDCAFPPDPRGRSILAAGLLVLPAGVCEPTRPAATPRSISPGWVRGRRWSCGLTPRRPRRTPD